LKASRELRTVRFFYNSLQCLVAEQNPVWNNLEKKKIIVQRGVGGFLSSSFPSLLQETGKMET